MDAKKKAIILALVGFFTLGIANFVYVFILSDKIIFDYKRRVLYPIAELLFTVCTLGIYGIYWTYKITATLDKREGYDTYTVNSLVTTVLSACFLRSISMAMIYFRLECLAEANEN